MNESRERFRLLYETHAGRVLAFALRRVNGQEEAREVVAETFLVAWRRLDQVPSDPLPWLFGVARNVIANQRRSVRRHEALSSKLAGSAVDVRQHDHADDIVAHDAVTTALQRLSGWDQQALMLVAWEHLDNRRAAAAMGCSPATFAVRLNRARRRLQREITRGEEATRFPALAEEVR